MVASCEESQTASSALYETAERQGWCWKAGNNYYFSCLSQGLFSRLAACFLFLKWIACLTCPGGRKRELLQKAKIDWKLYRSWWGRREKAGRVESSTPVMIRKKEQHRPRWSCIKTERMAGKHKEGIQRYRRKGKKKAGRLALKRDWENEIPGKPRTWEHKPGEKVAGVEVEKWGI